MDAGRLRTDLGWTSQVSFADGLAATIEWYRKNKEWWKVIHSGDYLADRKTARAMGGKCQARSADLLLPAIPPLRADRFPAITCGIPSRCSGIDGPPAEARPR